MAWTVGLHNCENKGLLKGVRIRTQLSFFFFFFVEHQINDQDLFNQIFIVNLVLTPSLDKHQINPTSFANDSPNSIPNRFEVSC